MNTDYRFYLAALRLREENKSTYAFSQQGSQELSRNDSGSTEFTEEMWDEFWEELHREYGENNS